MSANIAIAQHVSAEQWRPPSLLGQSLLQAGRLVRRWRTFPPILLQTFMFPVVLFVMFRIIFADSIELASGADNIAALTALMAVYPALFGSTASGQSLIVEREAGVLRRFDVMPVPKGGDILGRAWAEFVRMACSALVLVLVASLFGFRFAGVGALVEWIVLLGLITTGFLAVGLTIGAACTTVAQAQVVEPLYMIMLFLNTGMVPLAAFPDAIQPVVNALPVSVAVNALKAVSEGGASATQIGAVTLWFGGLTVVFGALGVRLMRHRR